MGRKRKGKSRRTFLKEDSVRKNRYQRSVGERKDEGRNRENEVKIIKDRKHKR